MNREIKKRYKMYKAGKNWVVAPLVFLGLIVGIHSELRSVSADSMSTAQVEEKASNKTSAVVDQEDITLKNSEDTSQSEVTKESANQDNIKNKVESSATKNEVIENSNDASITRSQVTANKVETNSVGNQVDSESIHTNTHANEAAFDSVYLNDEGQLHVEGWHAADDSESQQSAWMIVYDATANREIKRQQYNTVERADVKRTYPTIYNAKYSGFNLNIDLSSYNLVNHTIQLVARYSNDARNGEGQRTDRWSNSFKPFENVSYVDNFSIDKNLLHVSGWHASDYSNSRRDQYIILFDNTRGHEIARVKVGNTTNVATAKRIIRSDVRKAYPTITNAEVSGYDVIFNLSKLNYIGGNQISIVSRYVGKNTEDTSTDVWSASRIFKNSAYNLDNFSFNGNYLTVEGWHVSDYAKQMPNQYLILFDQTTGHEVSRVKVGTNKTGITSETVKREDARNAYRNIYSNGDVGFKAKFDMLKFSQVTGHKLQVVIRYSSDAKDGEGQRQDFWSQAKDLSQVAYALDSFKLVGNKLEVSGWSFDANAFKAPNKYLILFDKTAGHELTRVRVGTNNNVAQATKVNRPDVQKVYPNNYAPLDSGFSATFEVDKLEFDNNHDYQIVMRQSNDSDGNGKYYDQWSWVRKFNQSAGSVDTVSVKGHNIALNGWFASDFSLYQPYRYVIIFDKTLGHEIARAKVTNEIVRPDVQHVYPNLHDANESGFSVTFTDLSAYNQGHTYQYVLRFSNQENGEGKYTDTWSGYFHGNGQKYNGLMNENGQVYFYRDGYRQTGWQDIDGHRYYFDPVTQTQAKSTILWVDGVAYAFNGNGDVRSFSELNNLINSLGTDMTIAIQSQNSGQIYSYANFSGKKLVVASTVKVAVLAELLHNTGGNLTAYQRSLAEIMIRNSDNNATTTLLNNYLEGRSNAAANLYRDLGMNETIPGWSWGVTQTTPRDQLKLLYEIFMTDNSWYLNRQSQDYIRNLMHTISISQRWGISAGSSDYYLKNGWLTGNGYSDWYVNSIGFIPNDGKGYTIAIYSYNNPLNTGISKVEQVARKVAEMLK
ncbi:KxYKxGKxW signal peptide domain-containing protein [Ligilactobacillus equi]|uniref:KxYKxGKxW signal peptide domain-containing protein n=1 Tax=Ligilactobacillus equi TaxID=137357 RepID=UPI0005542320|nr:KxYKxGKxW signal peptide domain-containing protein [Ligilactobacillus equi]